MVATSERVSSLRRLAWQQHKSGNFQGKQQTIEEMRKIYNRVAPPHSKECDEYNEKFPGCGVPECPHCSHDRRFWGDLWKIASV